MSLLVLLLLLLLHPLVVSSLLFHPGALLKDTNGTIIRAHQPHVYTITMQQQQNNTNYVLLGSSKVGASAGTQGVVNMYTSTDLHSWQFKGGVYNHSGDSRPSLLGRNPRTGLYVLWAKGGGRSFQSATSKSLNLPFTFNGSYVPESSCTAGDSAAFLDPVSGNAYMVYSQHTCNGATNRAMKLLLLNDDWTAPAFGSKGTPMSTCL